MASALPSRPPVLASVARACLRQLSTSSHTHNAVPEVWPHARVPVERAYTPPASWYTSAEVLRREEERVFRNTWQLVGHSAQVAQPGEYFVGSLLKTRYVVVRGTDGVLRAFHNVCRHHAAAVASGSGCAKRFTCPYHGWTYALDGRLEKATRLGGIKDFKPKDNGLVPIRVQAWGNLIFAQLGSHLRFWWCGTARRNGAARGDTEAGQVESLEDWMGEAGVALEAAGLLDPLQFVRERVYEVGCNWKVVCDNYLDGGYHVPFAHKGLAANLDLDSYRSDLYPNASIQITSTVGGTVAAADSRLGDAPATYAFLYPNTMLNRYGPWLDTNVVVPLAPDRCKVVFQYFLDPTHPSASDEAWVERSLQDSHAVQEEDTQLCEEVQAGLDSPAYGAGRYAPRLEHPMFHFHQQLHSHLRVADDIDN